MARYEDTTEGGKQIKMATAVEQPANFRYHFVSGLKMIGFDMIRCDVSLWRKIVQLFGLETASESLTKNKG